MHILTTKGMICSHASTSNDSYKYYLSKVHVVTYDMYLPNLLFSHVRGSNFFEISLIGSDSCKSLLVLKLRRKTSKRKSNRKEKDTHTRFTRQTQVRTTRAMWRLYSHGLRIWSGQLGRCESRFWNCYRGTIRT